MKNLKRYSFILLFAAMGWGCSSQPEQAANSLTVSGEQLKTSSPSSINLSQSSQASVDRNPSLDNGVQIPGIGAPAATSGNSTSEGDNNDPLGDLADVAAESASEESDEGEEEVLDAASEQSLEMAKHKYSWDSINAMNQQTLNSFNQDNSGMKWGMLMAIMAMSGQQNLQMIQAATADPNDPCEKITAAGTGEQTRQMLDSIFQAQILQAVMNGGQ